MRASLQTAAIYAARARQEKRLAEEPDLAAHEAAALEEMHKETLRAPHP